MLTRFKFTGPAGPHKSTTYILIYTQLHDWQLCIKIPKLYHKASPLGVSFSIPNWQKIFSFEMVIFLMVYRRVISSIVYNSYAFIVTMTLNATSNCNIPKLKFYSTFEIIYVTASLPLLLLFVLLIRGATLDGAMIGIEYYLKPNLTKMQEPQVGNIKSIYIRKIVCISVPFLPPDLVTRSRHYFIKKCPGAGHALGPLSRHLSNKIMLRANGHTVIWRPRCVTRVWF